MPGTLILASNHLGLSEDTPSRSLKALHEAQLVIFESDRGARSALKAAGLHREWLRWSEQRESATLESLRKALASGLTVCYMSDQGSPCLEDPGQELAAVAHALGAGLRVIPGPSSVTAALCACPFPTRGVIIAGLLPRDEQARLAQLRQLAATKRPFVVMDAPYRLQAVASALASALPGRNGLLALDISGAAESFRAMPLQELPACTQSIPKTLNFLIVIDAGSTTSHPSPKRTSPTPKRPYL